MGQMARHLNAEHAQGVPSRLMQPAGGRPPSQPRVPIHLMMPHSTNVPGSGASSRQPTPGASNSVLQSRTHAAPTHVVPRYDVYGFALKEPPSGDAARQLRTMNRGPEVPEHWSNPHPALCPYPNSNPDPDPDPNLTPSTHNTRGHRPWP